MAEVSVSTNKGIGPVKVKNTNATGGGVGSTAWYATEQSEPINVENYTVHGYQVQVVDGTSLSPSTASATTNAAVYIEATNDEDVTHGGNNTYRKKGGIVHTPKNFQVIAQYNIQGLGAGNQNTDGIMYSDIWNFKWARVRVNVSVPGSRKLIILEKHNA